MRARSRCFIMAFSLLQLTDPILRALKEEGYTTPTPIQAKAIPPILEGRDVLGCAQTGTGKTAAFALPILHKLMTMPVDKARRGPAFPRALILSPTRELATQIGESFATYGRHTGLVHTCIYGGVSQFHQVRALHRGVDILVATPGRLEDLMQQRVVNLSEVCVLVLDEADRMLDMGFIAPIRRIAAALPNTAERPRHTLLFSATMPKEIMHLADSLLKNPVKVAVTPVASAAPLIEQRLYFVNKDLKQGLLQHLLKDESIERAVVFTKTKFGADRVSKKLRSAGIRAGEIHGNKQQNQRQRALDAFRDGRTRVLVATDVAARGLDVDGITHVFNFDLPMEPESYVHRIGRTGRAGATGIAIAFCDKAERGLLRQVERLTGKQIPTLPTPEGIEHVASGAGDFEDHREETRGAPASRGGHGRAGERQASGRPAPARPTPSRHAGHSAMGSASHAAKPGVKSQTAHARAEGPATPYKAHAPAKSEHAPVQKPVSASRSKPAHKPAETIVRSEVAGVSAPRSSHAGRMPMTDPIVERPAKNYDYSGILEDAELKRPVRTTEGAGVRSRPHVPAEHANRKPPFARDQRPAFGRGGDARPTARDDDRRTQRPSFGKPLRGDDRRDDRFGGGRERSVGAPRRDDRNDGPRGFGDRGRFDDRRGGPRGFERDGADRFGAAPRARRDDRFDGGPRPARPAAPGRERAEFEADRASAPRAGSDAPRGFAPHQSPRPASSRSAPRIAPAPGTKPTKTGLHAGAAKPKPAAAQVKMKKKSTKKPHRKGAAPSRPFAGGGTPGGGVKKRG